MIEDIGLSANLTRRDVLKAAGLAGAAGVVLLDARGQVLGTGAAEGRAGLLAVLGGRVAATTDRGLVAAFEAGR